MASMKSVTVALLVACVLAAVLVAPALAARTLKQPGYNDCYRLHDHGGYHDGYDCGAPSGRLPGGSHTRDSRELLLVASLAADGGDSCRWLPLGRLWQVTARLTTIESHYGPLRRLRASFGCGVSVGAPRLFECVVGYSLS